MPVIKIIVPNSCQPLAIDNQQPLFRSRQPIMAPTMNITFDPSLDEVHLFTTPRGSFDDRCDQNHHREHRHQPHHTRIIDSDHPALLGSLTPPIDCPPTKILNFSPGPTNLPPAVESAIQSRCFPAMEEKRLGSMALSHRSPEFECILKRTLAVTRQVMEIPPEYEILFTQGGGHGQFAAIPMNLCPTGSESATYVVNGTWSNRAVEEAKKYCRPHVISAMEEDGRCTSFPSLERIQSEIDPNSAFLYVCSNETVNGLELHRLLPRLACGVPLVVDASSDFTSKPIAWRESNIGVLFACASKNIGHPGVTMVVVRKDLLGRANPFTPGVFNYQTNIMADNVWNTIPTFNVDVVGIVMEWIMENGGVHSMERTSIAKSNLMYDMIGDSNGFYGTPVKAESGYRSRMNVPFCVAGGDDRLTDLFLVECWERGIVGLRTVTPFSKSIYLRASLYHGVAYEEVVVLTNFMKEFAAKHTAVEQDSAVVEQQAGVVTPTDSPLFRPAPASPLIQQALYGMDLCLSNSRDLDQINKLSSSPDTVNDPSLTWPKNLKVNQYSRVTDMFAPPPTNLGPAPPALR
mmetsp:Transcript_28260/g.46369  ORF Transcript_28260/g.46369 Transcript_28260/m.46369 type:complete len:575 (-) Transcript_28260:183-1907(-)